jgi:hypothetical protein
MAKTSFYSGSGATSNDVDAVDGLKTAAENAKTAAETAQAAAETAKSGADTAKSGADTSATAAATSATAAASSATAASTSATAAATSATAAAASASSVNNYTGGTGITVSGTTITNDSPDQTVALTAGSNVSVSGTYPNFTISSTDTNTTYSVGDGGLTEKNFTTTLKNKLDAVEANATADQSNAEIRAAVEAATDSNVFTDADHSKLGGIATSANNYSLPTASSSTLGGIKIGSGLAIDGSGVVTASGGGGGGSSLTVQDEGSALSTAATTMNFTGNGVVASGTGATKTITVTDTNTTYSIGDGGLTENNFTDALKSKLDGIETSATADQTDAQIRAAVEAATDSNVFTDADHSKLNAIEASADVTDTANVVAALTAGTNVSIAANGTISSTDTNTTYSVGDGGLTQNNFTNTLKSKLDAIEANATADQTASEIKTAYESNSDTNAFTDADHTKLDGIAASANNYVHPNHSGEVTSTADGATVISDNVVDEANLKVSNSPTNGYVLTAQSGNTGGLTWAAASGGGSGISNVVEDTTPQLGGDLDANSKSIKFGDRSSSGVNELVFGDGDDLKIFHGTNNHSQIIEGGSGNLQIYATNLELKASSGHDYLKATYGGAVELYHNSSKKLETTSSGIKTTGTVSVNNAYTLPTSDGSANYVLTTNGSGVANWAAASGGGASSIDDLSDAEWDGSNLSIGTNSFSAGSSHYRNVAIGWNTGNSSITTGDDNVLIGRNTGSYLTTGTANTAVGQNALQGTNLDKLTGSNNVGIGQTAGSAVTSGSSNTFVGDDSNGTGNVNYQTALGYNAKTAGAGATAINNSYASGSDSLAGAIANNTSSYGAQGANSIALGQQTKATGTAAVKIGRMGTIAGDYSVGLGNGGDTTSNATFSVALQATYLNASNSLGFGGESQVDSGHDRSIVLGRGAKSRTKGGVHFGGYNAISAGQNQSGIYVLASNTTDATAEALTTDNSTAGTSNQVVLPNNSAYAFSGTIVARQKASEGTASAAWKVEGLIRREGSAGTTVLVNSATTVLDNTPSWGMALSADTTNGCLKIAVNGAASTNVRFVGTITTSELIYA